MAALLPAATITARRPSKRECDRHGVAPAPRAIPRSMFRFAACSPHAIAHRYPVGLSLRISLALTASWSWGPVFAIAGGSNHEERNGGIRPFRRARARHH